MRYLKPLGIGLAALLALFLAVAYALPRHVSVEREIVVAAAPGVVFPHLNSLRNFNKWSPWAARDPETRYVFSGPEYGVGNRSEWSSDNPQVGNGAQEIVESVENELVRTDLDFGAQGLANGYYRLTEVDGGTRVVWGFETDMGNSPVARYMGLMMDDWVGGDFEKGLIRLKALVEAGEGPIVES